MLSAEECIANANALIAKAADGGPRSEEYLTFARQWMELSIMAEFQDEILELIKSPGPPKAA